MEPPKERKWDEVTPEGLYNIIEYLKCNFDPELSRKVIELFHERMRDDIEFDPVLLHSLMKHVFAQIMGEGKGKKAKNADQAFGLEAVKGGYERPDTTSRDICAAAIVILQMRKDITWESAVTDAAEQMSIGDRIVQRAYKTHKDGYEWMPDNILKLLVSNSLPPP